jgi:hypothetical protein
MVVVFIRSFSQLPPVIILYRIIYLRCTLLVTTQRLRQFTPSMTRPIHRPPGRLECSEPSMCATCLWAYPPGCLHILQECERNTPQMNGIMDAYERWYTQCCDTNHPSRAVMDEFWDLPENARWVDKNMVRFIYFKVMKFLVQKEQISRSWEREAHIYLLNGALGLSGMIMCGSNRIAVKAIKYAIHPGERLHELEAESHKLFGLAYNEIMDMTLNCSYGNKGVMLIMNIVSPCACLSEEVRQSLRDIRFRCVACADQEEGNVKFKACSGCQIARYCSRRCQKMHWNSTLEMGRHKEVCLMIRKLLKLDFD